MAYVFITQENNRLNFSDAERFGDIRFITDREFTAHSGSILNEKTWQEIRQNLAIFDPAEDHLLLSGDPVVISLSMHVVLSKFGSVNVLKWDGQNHRYVGFTVTAEEQ